MRNLSATEAARQFSEILDAVERDGESFVVVRRGRPVAKIGPTSAATGRLVKGILRSHSRDRAWAGELARLRAGLTVEERSWNG